MPWNQKGKDASVSCLSSLHAVLLLWKTQACAPWLNAEPLLAWGVDGEVRGKSRLVLTQEGVTVTSVGGDRPEMTV